jgi:hypothetical protein
VPRDNIFPFLSPTPPNSAWVKKPCVTEVEGRFRRLLEDGRQAMSKGRNLGRRLYLFLAGHGIEAFPHQKYVALLMIEADLDFFASEHIAGLVAARALLLSGCFQEVVLFMDACRTEQSLSGMRPFFNIPARELNPAPQKFFALAVKWGKKAREVPTLQRRRWAGRFSTYVLDGLQGKARAYDKSGAITGLAMQSYLLNRYNILKEKTPRELHDKISDPDYEVDPQFVFAPGGEACANKIQGVDVAVSSRAGDTLPAFRLVSPEGNEVVGVYRAKRPPRVIKGMAPGIYRMVSTDGRSEKFFEVHVEDVLDIPSDTMSDVTVGVYDPASGGLRHEDV